MLALTELSDLSTLEEDVDMLLELAFRVASVESILEDD